MSFRLPIRPRPLARETAVARGPTEAAPGGADDDAEHGPGEVGLECVIPGALSAMMLGASWSFDGRWTILRMLDNASGGRALYMHTKF